MIQFMRLNHIQICVPKGAETEARAFYCDILGLREIAKPKALQANGGFWLEVATSPPLQLHIGTENLEQQSVSKRHPAFEVADLETARAYLIERGVNIQNDQAIPDIERFSIIDPWQNRIELMQFIDSETIT